MSFTKQIKRTVGQPSSVRVGTIVSTNPLQVEVQGQVFAADAVGVVGPYFPVSGDVVSVLGQSSDSGSDPASWLILGSNTVGNTGGQAGTASVTFVAQTSFLQPVNFARPFATAPAVFTNIASGAGATAGWQSRAISISTTGFNVFVFGTVNSWTGVPVQWHAVSLNQ